MQVVQLLTTTIPGFEASAAYIQAMFERFDVVRLHPPYIFERLDGTHKPCGCALFFGTRIARA